jgi:phenylalanyl-tRNA synthetase beta chain
MDIESIEFESDKFKNFIVAEVISKEKHPDADKLSLCKVNTGSETLNVVCGASNVDAGQKVVLAKIGAVIPNGGFEIKKSKIRGQVSEGMICAEDELGLSDDHSGIMVLNPDAPVGTDFADYSGHNDILIDIGVTPNRGDMLSHFGMAREFAAILNTKIKIPKLEIHPVDEQASDYIKISTENPEYCKRFTGRIVKDVTIKESPGWLKKYLTAIGLRPKNNVVDITNFVMMETGQPLHAFDYDKIRGKEIIVKTAKAGEKFKTLDGKERILNDKSLMVCDAEKPSSIAGIMGGEESEITDDTKNVFIESAYFDPVCIRKNSKALGLISDSSQRFERGVDIDMVEYASGRCAMLIEQLANGKVLKGMVDLYPEKFKDVFVPIRVKRAEEILGINLTEEEITSMLESIEIDFSRKEEDKLIFLIPNWRREDLTREIDLIEEAARLYGYERIPASKDFSMDISSHFDFGEMKLDFLRRIKQHFIGRGFNEIITYSQQDEKKIKFFSDEYVKIENPNSIEMNVMRVNLLYGMLKTMGLNHNLSGKDVSQKLFEAGKVFFDKDNRFIEKNYICFGLSGINDFRSFDVKDREYDVYDLKGEVEMFMNKINIENYDLNYYNVIGDDCKIADVLINKVITGSIYRFTEDGGHFVEKEQIAYLAEFDIDELFRNSKKVKQYTEINKYPSVKRDLAFLCPDSLRFDEISRQIYQSGGKILTDVRLFDIYKDEKLGKGIKSIALSLDFVSKEKTLTDEEVNKQIEKIKKALEKNLGLQIRA